MKEHKMSETGQSLSIAPKSWPYDYIVVPIPEGCNPCRFCGKHCMEAETEVDKYGNQPPWIGQGNTRMYTMCDEYYDKEEWGDIFWKDDIRTEYGSPEEVRDQWNEMNP